MTFTIVQNDTAPPITSQLSDSGEAVDLSNVSNIRFHMEDEFKNVIVDDDLTGDVDIVDANLGKVAYEFDQDDTSNVGSYKGEWQVLYSDGTIETYPSNTKVNIEVTEEIK
jgi:hypothetical protein